MSNIKINNVRKLSLKLRGDEYWDFMLFKEEARGGNIDEAYNPDYGCVAAFIDAEDSVCTEYFDHGKVFSKLSWIDAVNSGDDEQGGVTLKNIGFTGIDNGLVYYDKDLISNIEFFNIFTRSHFSTCGDTRLNLSAVKSNTGEHWFPIHLKEDETGKYFECKGGFLQGFFKTYGYKYQTLPDYISSDWTLQFSLRRRDEYGDGENTLNAEHQENRGIFFYMGARAENKFWEMFASDEEKEKMRRSFISDGYVSIQKDVEDVNENNSKYEFDTEYAVEPDKVCPVTPVEWITPGVIKFDSCDNGACHKFACELSCSYDTSLSPDYYNPYKCGDENNPWVEAGYLVKDISLDGIEVVSDGGYSLNENTDSYYEITSDNKYLLFNQTCSGYTVSKWENEGAANNTFIFVAQKKKIPNYYLLFNQTCTGYTVNTIDEYYNEQDNSYDFYKDIYRNAFCLKVNDDGSISYRYAIKNCGSGSTYYDYPGEIVDDKLKIIEETTNPGFVKDGEWADITVRFSILGPNVDDHCSTKVGKRDMKIYIYVGGYLKFISRPLPEFLFRPLKDVPDKQEAVPYNISIGGGTQGLADVVTLDYMSHTEYTLPIEKVFAGSFIGDIRYFKFYNCGLDLPTIRLPKTGRNWLVF